jgi:TRAP-type C4-dicarboxylate transport system permease small subunit
VLRVTGLVEDGVLVALLVAMILLGAGQILLRNVFQSGLLWADPALRVMVLWVGLLGAVAATRDDRHITVDVVSRFLPSGLRAAARVVTDLFAALVSGLICWHAVRLVINERAAATIAFASVPVWACELILPVAFGIIAGRYLLMGALHLRRAVVGEAGQ